MQFHFNAICWMVLFCLNRIAYVADINISTEMILQLSLVNLINGLYKSTFYVICFKIVFDFSKKRKRLRGVL